MWYFGTEWFHMGFICVWSVQSSMVGAEQYGSRWFGGLGFAAGEVGHRHSGTWGAAAKRLLASGASVHP